MNIEKFSPSSSQFNSSIFYSISIEKSHLHSINHLKLSPVLHSGYSSQQCFNFNVLSSTVFSFWLCSFLKLTPLTTYLWMQRQGSEEGSALIFRRRNMELESILSLTAWSTLVLTIAGSLASGYQNLWNLPVVSWIKRVTRTTPS